MSLQLDWEAIQSLENDIRNAINNRLLLSKSTSSFSISKLHLGNQAPIIRLSSIGDCHLTMNQEDFELALDIHFHSDQLEIVVEGFIPINHPTPRFMELPVRIVITGISMQGSLLIDRLHQEQLTKVSFIPSQLESPSAAAGYDGNHLSSCGVQFRFDSDIGDPSRKTLHNVAKVHAFIDNAISGIFHTLLVHPNHLTI